MVFLINIIDKICLIKMFGWYSKVSYFGWSKLSWVGFRSLGLVGCVDVVIKLVVYVVIV